jgi:methyl-accepting chemotaxis protein
VNTAVNQMDNVTQQNASMVGQATAAAAQLKREAIELGELMSQFDFGDQGVAPARPTPLPTRQDAKGLQRKLQAVVSGPSQSDWHEF